MNESITAGGGVSIVTEGWPAAVLAPLAVVGAFRFGAGFADRRVAALVAVVRSFCGEAAAYSRARADGRIDDAEAREITGAAGKFFVDLETAGAALLAEGLGPAP